MRTLQLQGTRDVLQARMNELYPAWPDVLTAVRRVVRHNHNKEVWPEQAALLGYMAQQYEAKKAPTFLEFGTNQGFTAAVLRLACPSAKVTTLEPDRAKRRLARQILAPLEQGVRPHSSVAFLEAAKEAKLTYDLIFVDGDHKNATLDLPYFNRLKPGGLFIHHDYAPAGSSRPCQPVFEALTAFGEKLGRGPDVLLQDETGTGIAGWYRKPGESW